MVLPNYRFEINYDLESVVRKSLETQDSHFLRDGFLKLVQRSEEWVGKFRYIG